MKVIVEIKVRIGLEAASILERSSSLEGLGFTIDRTYEPVSVPPPEDGSVSLNTEQEEIYCIRGDVDEKRIAELEKHPDVISVYQDTPISPFNKQFVNLIAGKDACPIPPCDCEPGDPKGTLTQILSEIGVSNIWSKGYWGAGVVIGIVDGGIKAEGRVAGGTMKRVIGGWPADWGTKAQWGEHGMMTGTDASMTAPASELYDIRISDASTIGGTISNALAGFDWAIRQNRVSAKELILSNSWGIYQESWDPNYARNPNHVFTRKVVQALNEGIIVLFAAGNCGGTCPDQRCGADNGPGRSIWGANGHPRVMCVGAANRNYEFIGYSSQGPAALDARKPDFCSFSHFTAYFPSDTGTSAACPVAAGVAALLKDVDPSLSQPEIKTLLESTAYNLGPQGWDPHSGAGVIQPYEAFIQVSPPAEPGKEVVFQNFHDGGWHLGGAHIMAQTGNPANTIRASLNAAKAHIVGSGGFTNAASLMDELIKNPTASNIGSVLTALQKQLGGKTCLNNNAILVQHIFNTGIQLGWAQWGSTNRIPKDNIMSNLVQAKRHADALDPWVYSTTTVYITRAIEKLAAVPDPILAHTEIANARTYMYAQLAGKKCFIKK